MNKPDISAYPTALAHTDKSVYFERDGEVLLAPYTNPINLDGYPSGRWECTLAHWKRFSPVVHAQFATLIK